MEQVSYREFARRLCDAGHKISEASVRNAVKSGWIIEGVIRRDSGRPALDSEKALEEWNASPAGLKAATRDTTPKSNYKPKKQRPAPEAPKDGQNGDKQPGAPKAPLFSPEAAKAKQEILEHQRNSSHIDLQMKALEFQRRLGTLVDRKKTEKALFEYGVTVRTAIEMVPDRHIDEVLSAPDRNSALTILQNALRNALETLSNPPNLAL